MKRTSIAKMDMNGTAPTKNQRDSSKFDKVYLPFLDGDVPHYTSYGVYISKLIRFTRVSSHVTDLNTSNKVLTAKLLNQGYRYQKRRWLAGWLFWA